MLSRAVAHLTQVRSLSSGANAKLMAAFAAITKSAAAAPAQPMLNVRAPSAVSRAAPQYDAENRANAPVPKRVFKPGDTYIPADLIDGGLDAEEMGPSPYVVVRKHVDVFRRTDYGLGRAHLNVRLLSSCISESGGIMHRADTGLSAKSQRHMARAIRRARVMGLVPYVARPSLLPFSV